MEIKPTDQLGASLLGRVGERGTGGAFRVSDQFDTGKAERSNRLAQELIRIGIKVTDKAIDARLEEAMIMGSTEAMAGVAEEAMETDILTRNFKIAGHRNMTASLRQQEWQSTMLQRVALGEFNNLNPTEFGRLLNKDMTDSGLMEVIGGMSREAKGSMLETMLTGNQTLIAQQQKSAVEAIVQGKLSSYGVQANALLSQAKTNLGTNLEAATLQQSQAFVRAIFNDPALPYEAKLKLITEWQKGASEMGLPNLAQAILNTPTGDDNAPLGVRLSTKDFAEGLANIDKAKADNRWLYKQEELLEFTAIKAEVQKRIYKGTEETLINYLHSARLNNDITDTEATSIYQQFKIDQYLNKNQSEIAKAYIDGNIPKMLEWGVSRSEGLKAVTTMNASSGMDLESQVSVMTQIFSKHNGAPEAIQWVGETVLKPIMSEVINSEGDVLTENIKVFNHVMSQAGGLDKNLSTNYLAQLRLSLPVEQADFIQQYVENRTVRGDSEVTALAKARYSYLKNQEASEVDRSASVKRGRKLWDSVSKVFNDPASLGNFLGWDNLKANVGSQSGEFEKLIGTPTPLVSTAHDRAVYQRASFARGIAETAAMDYLRTNPETASKKGMEVAVMSAVLGATMGEGDEVLTIGIDSTFEDAFPTIRDSWNAAQTGVELLGQKNEVTSYVLKNLDYSSLNTGMENLDNSRKAYEFYGGLLHVTFYGNASDEPTTISIPPEKYSHLVDEYKSNRIAKYNFTYVPEMFRADKAPMYVDSLTKARFKADGYNNKFASYDKNFIAEALYDNLRLEGFETKPYKDDLIGKGRVSIGMGVNSGNKFNSDGSRNDYTPYFEIAEERELTKKEAAEVTELALRDHLKHSASLIDEFLGKGYLGKSKDLELGILKLSYAQYRGNEASTAKIFEGVKEGDLNKLKEGLKESHFFKMSAGGDETHPQYIYVLTKLAGAMNELRSKGIR